MVVAVTLLSSLLLLSVVSGAQELGTAVLNGDVTDPQGAVVIGAHVIARRLATGVQRTSVTNHVGLFAFNNLAPGPYEVRVEAAGFAPATATVRLEVGQQASLKFPLTIEQEKATIVIDDRDSIPLINTVTSVVDGVINAQKIDNLPLNGGNFLERARLIRGTTMPPISDPPNASTASIAATG